MIYFRRKKICGNDLFYRADSHWNKVGGYIGAAAVIRKLSPETVLPPPGEFKIITENIPEPNDLKNQLLQAGLIKEYMEKSPDVPAVAAAIPKAYSVNKNPAAKDKRKVLIYRDSFTTNMSPWLSNHFQEIHYVWTQRVSKKQIAQIKPDIVIIECLSRLMIDIKCDLK